MRVPSRALLIVAIAGVSVVRAATPALVAIENPFPAADAAFGTGLTGLGDVNGDGVADLAAGAPGASKVFVFSGADRTLIRTIVDPEGKTGLNFGYAVTGAGDVTGDGVEDLAVGAPGPLGQYVVLPCDPAGSGPCPPAEWGRVFLVNGASGGVIRKLVPPSDSFLKFGFSLVHPGDLNGDAVPDLVVGAPVLDHYWGHIAAFSGATGGQLWMAKEPGAEKQAVASFGMFLAPIADLNGDGVQEVIVAAPFFDHDPASSLIAGKVFLVSGDDGAVFREHGSATPADNGFYGGKVSAIGDQNGDGGMEYLVGDRGRGVVDLRSGVTGAVIRSIAVPPGETAAGLFSFARAGDRDGDGKEDVWIGTPVTGVARLMNGSGAVLQQVTDPGVPALTVNGFGMQLAALSDVSGDSRPEVLIAKPAETVSGFANAGIVYVVTSNRPPDAEAGVDRTVSAGAGCTALVTLDGSGSSDPDGDTLTYTWSGSFGTASGVGPEVSLSLGTHVITLTVSDGNGGTDSDALTITVVDTSAPTIGAASATPEELWPANHQMVPVTIAITAVDNCSTATCRVVLVTSNQPIDGSGDGTSSPDWNITGDLTVDLRAERSGTDSDRVYGVVVECRDVYGNTSTRTLNVVVPHSKSF